MAGPLYSIVRRGGCEYVYGRDDWWFAGVSCPTSLRSRLLEWHAELAMRVGRFKPESETEQTVLTLMLSLVAAMRSVIDVAISVESRRWGNR